MGLSYTEGGMACGVERGWSEGAQFCRGLVVHGSAVSSLTALTNLDISYYPNVNNEGLR
jgi:hypothetical protein